MSNVTLNYLLGKRMWVVQNFSVWGETGRDDFLFLYTQIDSPSKRICFNQSYLGGKEQWVNFSSLYDWKGNNLPSNIEHPKVLVLSKKEVDCFIVGQETSGGFKIAKLVSGGSEDGLVDLLIVEMG